MALDMATIDSGGTPVAIFTNNQAAIRPAHEPRKQAGEYMQIRINKRVGSGNF